MAERALFTRRRKDIYIALHPETRAQVRQAHVKHGAGDNLAPAFTTDTASRTGRSERDVQRDATRGEHIPEDVLNGIQGTDLDKGVVLDALAKAPDPAAELAHIKQQRAKDEAKRRNRVTDKASSARMRALLGNHAEDVAFLPKPERRTGAVKEEAKEAYQCSSST